MRVLKIFSLPILALALPLTSGLPVAKPPVIEVDFMPMSCPNTLNVNSKGVFHVAVIGPVAGEITSAVIGGVSFIGRPGLLDQTSYTGNPSSCDPCTPAGLDGIVDVILRFNTQDVVNALNLKNYADGTCLSVTLSTNLGSASDNIRIVNKK